MPDEIISIPLPASDWPVIQAGLLELPGKFGIPVINRLNLALAATADVKKSAQVVELKEASDG